MTATAFDLSAAEATGLRARALDDGLVFEAPERSVYGLGRALTLPLPQGLADAAGTSEAVQALGRISDSADLGRRPGTAGTRPTGAGAGAATALPRAMAALPFDPLAPAELIVPEVLLALHPDGRATAVVVGDDPAELLELWLSDSPARTPVTALPDVFELRSARPHADYVERVASAVEEIRAGRLEKVVMAREVVITANRPFRQADLLERLRALHPSCTGFAVDGFVGASPELLVRFDGDTVESHPLAGTAARSGDPAADRLAAAALLASEKERGEHSAVVAAIAAGLSDYTTGLEVPVSPDLVELRNVCHLGSRMSGRVTTPGATALDLLAAIHPTPAVSGSPRDAALEYLGKLEDLDRGRYAGAVGWVDAAGRGEWWLGIRCGIVAQESPGRADGNGGSGGGATMHLFAGAGIVADSDPEGELRETQLKLQAMLAAAVRP